MRTIHRSAILGLSVVGAIAGGLSSPAFAQSEASVTAQSVMNQTITLERLQQRLLDNDFVIVEASRGARAGTLKAEREDVANTEWVTCGKNEPVAMVLDMSWRRWSERPRGGTVVDFEVSLNREGAAATDCELTGTFLRNLRNAI